MYQYEFENRNGETYKRISKQAARRIYEQGGNVVFCPCNIRPFGFYCLEIETNKEQAEQPFDNYVYLYELYNCCYTETGRYASYYIKTETEQNKKNGGPIIALGRRNDTEHNIENSTILKAA